MSWAHLTTGGPEYLMSKSTPIEAHGARLSRSGWRGLYQLGGATVVMAALLIPTEIAIGFLPGVQQATSRTVTVADWFMLLQDNWFVGLRNLGLLNIVGAMLLVPAILAVCASLWSDNKPLVALGAALFFMGTTDYLASSRSFPLLLLSSQYVHVTSDAQRSLLIAASRAGILIIEFSCLVISFAMLRSQVFNIATAIAGILGSVLMMLLEVAFMPPRGLGMIIAAIGGLSLMVWYVLLGLRLLQLGRPYHLLAAIVGPAHLNRQHSRAHYDDAQQL